MWLECTFLDYSCVSHIPSFLSSLQVTGESFLSSLQYVKEWPHLSLSPLGCWKLMTQRSQRVRQALHFHHTQILYCSTDHIIPELTQVLCITQCSRNTELIADVRSPTWFIDVGCFNTLPLMRSERKQIYRCLWLCFVRCVIQSECFASGDGFLSPKKWGR